jgi:predicted permease
LFRPSISPQTVAKFSQWITLPSLILHTLVPLTLSDVATYLPAIFAFAVPVSLTAATAWIVARTSHPKERGLLAGVSVGSSVSSVGVPLAAAFLGPAGLVASLFCTLIDVIASYFASYALFATAGAAFPESFVHADGGTYRGEWKGMIKEGHGVYTYPSGARYEGEWREGLKEGRGVYHFPKGGIYEGEWRGGVMAGVGVRTFATGKVRSGVWEKGKLAVPMEEWQCALAVEGASEAATVAKRVVVGGADFASAFRRLATQPAVAAFVVAGVLIATQRPLTPTAAMVVQKLAAAHVPLALLAFGLNMDLSPPQKHQVCQKQENYEGLMYVLLWRVVKLAADEIPRALKFCFFICFLHGVLRISVVYFATHNHPFILITYLNDVSCISVLLLIKFCWYMAMPSENKKLAEEPRGTTRRLLPLHCSTRKHSSHCILIPHLCFFLFRLQHPSCGMRSRAMLCGGVKDGLSGFMVDYI